ncbi:bifunctional DNA-formamidopyrimidine glycosylase/DNA-(apurinic or apyrimidinic site) lyase [Microtetraspora sp. NBRC 16547]|uniref:bifunctional DNA-formamidopyrimidine glycosylase/DNA-(apurinic or apyrimidinic site) lyase n=1 Tax=Microtetraspora sp. NBRC 16547 TaxID=3030993 RepID=UPI0024A2AE6E|nr:bifunctional DNA-formamidopyrimidine glycosylase/DNA-(apurinic or apyrimidinic site) lyase [Microtetraspora sp. NBRC 16547]GLX02630.1 formamidopyrimidine-DNA glycosylase [Microtetraspora sp. NBRC 16547]
MPELPEVEVVRRGLDQWVSGRTIASAEVLHPRAVRRNAGELSDQLKGREIRSAERRGKYLWLPLGDEGTHDRSEAADEHLTGPETDLGVGEHSAGEALLAHLGMSGQLLVIEPDAPLEKHLRVRIGFADGGPDLRFVDQRTFGHVLVAPMIVPARPPGAVAFRPVPEPVAHIAPDPFEDVFDDAEFAARLRRRRTGIKRALLDQSLISGVGNIYADEALWRARLHWARPTETLSTKKIAELLAAARAVMNEALGEGGTSFDSLYVNVNGESGYFDRSLAVYGRRDEPCRRCGTPIRREAFMNRSSYSCPRCQPRPRDARP